ncbi:MAG TPA: UDP-N-acetylmuramoyl-L-alanine--D-glutamate ligase, partial [Casimicrobiaceae bacterium]
MVPDYRGRRAVVLGLGLTGLSLARHLARHGAGITIADTRDDPPALAALRRELPSVAV